ncbi:MAG: prepilin-type N-terminal cleavage/methylation domain-containing protein [bacterium]
MVQRKRRAFTLIELLIVVAIIGILAAIAVPNFMNARIRSLVARVEGDLSAISTALEMYNLDNGKYPNHMEYGNNTLGKAGMKKLSTPVSYIAQGVIWDPFGPSTDTAKMGYPPPHSYFYHDRDTCIAERGEAWWDNYDPDDKFKWYLSSSGPDHLFYHPSPGRNWLLSYQPSNGLISYGNMFRYGPGNTKEFQVHNPG